MQGFGRRLARTLCYAIADTGNFPATGTITMLFDVDGTAGVTPLTFVATNFAGEAGTSPPGTTTNGSIDVGATSSPAPEVNAVPPPGARTLSDPMGDGATSDVITISNTGNSDLTLSLVATGDTSNVLAGTLASGTVVGGATTTLTIACAALATGPATATYSVTTNDTTEPTLNYNYTCIGTAPEVSALPGHRIISDPVDGIATSITTRIHNAGSLELTLSVDSPPAPFTAALSTTAVAANTYATLTIACDAAAAGPVTAIVTVSTNDADEPALTYTITCTGSVGPTPEVEANPPPGQRIVFSRTVETIRNIGTAELTLSVNSPVFTAILSSSRVAPGDRATLTVGCDVPLGAPPAAGRITISTNDIDEPTLRYDYICYARDPTGIDFSVGSGGGGTSLPPATPVPWIGQPGQFLLAASMLFFGLLGLAIRRRAADTTRPGVPQLR